jgi:signal transduction histidine kinase
LVAGVHALVGVLLLVVALTSRDSDGPTWALLAAVAVFALVYASGVSSRVHMRPHLRYVWGAVLTTVWVVLMLLTASAVWLAFPLFFLAMHVLPLRIAVPVVAALTIVAVTGFAWQAEEWTLGGVLGPVLGASVVVGIALGVGALNEQSQQRGVLEERDRLAREVHDTLAQGLSSIHLLLGAAEAQLAAGPVEPLRLVAQARVTAAENLAEARRFVRALTPPDLAERSLPDALAHLTARVESPGVSLVISGDRVPLPGSVEVALLRIAQEALGNAVRHAEASQIAVTLSYMDDAVALDVVDDGTGIDAHRSGFGMTSMRQRAETLAGVFTVESATDRGTAVAVRIPVDLP